MTAIATDGATPEETDDIRRRVDACVRHSADGTAATVASRRHPVLIQLTSEGGLQKLVKLAVPIGDGRHMTATRLVRVRWEESPDEPDVSGIIPGGLGRVLTPEEASRHNTRTIRRARKAEQARRRLQDLLREADRLPAGSIEILTARQITSGGHGDRYFRTPDGRVARTTTEYDWPTRIAISAEPVPAKIIAAGLGLKRGDVPDFPGN